MDSVSPILSIVAQRGQCRQKQDQKHSSYQISIQRRAYLFSLPNRLFHLLVAPSLYQPSVCGNDITAHGHTEFRSLPNKEFGDYGHAILTEYKPNLRKCCFVRDDGHVNEEVSFRQTIGAYSSWQSLQTKSSLPWVNSVTEPTLRSLTRKIPTKGYYLLHYHKFTIIVLPIVCLA